jgi:hypothetical protein
MDTGIFWVVMVIGAVIAFAIKASQGDSRVKAKAGYQASLQALTIDPTNPELRQKTLELGREYSRLTRNSRGVTIFDEVALSNDINAAAGGTTALASPMTPNSTTAASVENRLANLSRLKEQGLISDEEYSATRRKILEDV